MAEGQFLESRAWIVKAHPAQVQSHVEHKPTPFTSKQALVIGSLGAAQVFRVKNMESLRVPAVAKGRTKPQPQPEQALLTPEALRITVTRRPDQHDWLSSAGRERNGVGLSCLFSQKQISWGN